VVFEYGPNGEYRNIVKAHERNVSYFARIRDIAMQNPIPLQEYLRQYRSGELG
jgi:hypothetical protein